MVIVSSPPPQLSSSLSNLEVEDTDIGRMEGLLEKLKINVVELILQGDDVTRQMWQMYSVFEEIFGRQTMTTSNNEPLKHVVVGDRIKGSSMKPSKSKSSERPTIDTAASPQISSSMTVSSIPSTPVIALSSNSTPTVPSPVAETKSESPISANSTMSPQNKVPSAGALPSGSPSVKSSPQSSDRPSDSPSAPSNHQFPKGQELTSSGVTPAVAQSSNLTSNPLLDTIGALATSNPDSDDSDLDIVYQQLRYRGRHRRPEQVRIRTHRTHSHQHQPVASSDPESIGYAGSNSIDSGYKSLCATPEVSDSLSAPEVRRSASDVSASDSSTTSGRPRSLDGQDGKTSKIKMGTRSIAGKIKAVDRSPRQPHTTSAINDVTLDHLMYLRQSLRKDRVDAQRSPNDSIPSSVTTSTFRDSDLSPRPITDEEWRDQCRPYPFRTASSSSSHSAFTGRDGRSSRGSSRSEEIDQEGGGESSSDFLLSGVEYYDLESIQEFPPSNNYVTMLEEKTRCARFQLVSASKCPEPFSERQLTSLYRKRSESSQSVDGGLGRSQHQQIYGATGHPLRAPRSPAKVMSRHHKPHHATDSKLTEAAIRVLEMIEDFRMEEAMSRSGRMLPYQATGDHHQPIMPTASGATSNYPSSAIPHQAFLPRYRKSPGLRAGVRPASTGSLLEQEIDARSVASSSSYAASAEHHVYEEIMYDLVCERAASASDRSMPPPIPPERGRMVRSRLLPVPPHIATPHHQPPFPVDPRRIMVRSHKHRSSNLYSMLSSARGHNNVDRYLEMEWRLAPDRRDNLPPDFPV
ncbi:serine-rich adhesin for platelets-like [Stegodyphus dumicola]|uniref:serine-rich adhesin for platelets-like n=1 Tax=Stegodyphus dumicola TaxID=202533 RepID=UPI0015AB5174|nr:serine-rich adhesin for platelets-like [Stegodyphus dumicola]XP_035225196.1 serine-rich adhesin for platelets-like [Stegodyphus dumicola]